MVVFGAAGVGSVTGFGAYIYISQTKTFPISNPIPPALFVGVTAVLIAWVFLSIYSFASDALLQAFLLDEELRFAGNSRPADFKDLAEEGKHRGCCNCC